MKTLLVAAAATLLLAAPASASLTRDLDHLVDSGVPGAIALTRDGDHTTRLAAGYGDVKTRTPMRATDRFRAGSVTKAFTATVVLQLAGEGRLSLDDSVQQRLPGLVPNGAAVTLRQLLNMSSGLPDYLATAHPAHFEPGSSWSYCNTCYVLLGMIAEQVTGRPIATELRDRIFAGAGLHDTSFDRGPRIAGRHAHGYESGGADVTELDQSWSWTAGAIVSTADDIARFYRALLGGKLLEPAQMRELRTPFATESPFGPGILTGYSTGVFRMTLPCGEVWGHDGGTPGYRTFTVHRADGRRQVVVMANLGEDSLNQRQLRALNRVITTAYCGADRPR
jgi:D-alanyl-D-alanine carboxypeptidase